MKHGIGRQSDQHRTTPAPVRPVMDEHERVKDPLPTRPPRKHSQGAAYGTEPLSSITVPAALAFEVQSSGDILRRVRSLHPSQDALKTLTDAEAAAATSGLLLENAYRQHQENLDRVDLARQAMLLNPTQHTAICPEPAPFLPSALTEKKPQIPASDDLQVVKSAPGHPDLLEGLARIDRVGMFEASKASGMLTMANGRPLRWAGAASYVDALNPLFHGAPVVVRGFFDDHDRFVLTLIRAASRDEWDVPDAGQEELMLLGQDTVSAAAQLRKRLIRLYGPTCQSCEASVSKATAAAAQDGERITLLCHLCKALRSTSDRVLTAVA